MSSVDVCFFANDIVLVDETRCGVNVKLGILRCALELKGFWLKLD